jgi:tetratricopeptide (TPR) repeat protein
VLPKADDATVALRLRREAQLLKDRDAYVVLGVPHGASPDLVARAGERMKARYQELTHHASAEIRVLAQAILDRVVAAIAEFEHPPERVRMSASDEAFEAGLRAMHHGEWAVADRHFVRARDAEIDSPRNLAHLGWARFHNPDLPIEERVEEGIQFLRLAEEFDAGYADGQYFLAVVLHRSGDDEGANKRLRRAIKVQPDHAPALALARKLRKAGPWKR